MAALREYWAGLSECDQAGVNPRLTDISKNKGFRAVDGLAAGVSRCGCASSFSR